MQSEDDQPSQVVARSAQSDLVGLHNRWNFQDQVVAVEQSEDNVKNLFDFVPG